MELHSFYQGKKILVTGAAGTVGREIVNQLLTMNTAELRLMDNNETEVFYLLEEVGGHKNVHCFLGDVRDQEKVEKLVRGVDIVLHLAAFKHVILSEYNPFDVVQTNIIGVKNIVNAVRNSGTTHMLFTSSDKAVNPTNVMGTSKLMGERLVTAANSMVADGETVFTSSRFGNVIGSRGSVVPLFMRQIRKGGPVTITDERMTRFIMTTEEAARLVLKSLIIAKGGEVFVMKMPVARIPDLAQAMIELLAPRYGYAPSDIKIKHIGAKPGEKLYEELLSEEEVHRSMELKDMFVVTPAFRAIYGDIDYRYDELVSDRLDKSYVSANEDALSVEEIKAYLQKNNLLEELNGAG